MMKKFFRKSSMVTIIIALLTMVVAACSSGTDTGGKVEIKVAAWNDAADSLEASIPGFNKKYPDIKVTIVRVTPDYQKITPALTSGIGAPDIIQTQQRDFHNFLMKFPNQFVDVTDKLGSHKDEFAEVAWKSVEKDGKVYATPWDLGPAAVYYRKDYFQKAGIDPNSLTTWDKFIAAGKQLQAKVPSVNMTTMDIGVDAFDPYSIFMNQQSGDFYSKNGEVDLTHKASYDAINLVKRFKDEGITLNSPTWDDRVRAVTSGKTATIINPVWYAGTIRHQAKDQQGKWGIMPLPSFTEGGGNQANLGGSILAITKQSKNQDAAWKFIEYNLLTNEGQDVQVKYGLFPAWKPYYTSAGAKKKDEYFDIALVDFFGKLSTSIPPMTYDEHFKDFGTPIQTAISSILSKNVAPEKAFKDAEQKIAKQSGLKVAP
jgi:lactose/L-arabinose transport system substrate-binding protein